MVQVASLVSVLSVLQKRYSRWLARWRAKSATDFKLRLAILLSFGIIVTVIGAALYRWSNPEEDWSSSLFTVYAVSPSLETLHSRWEMGAVRVCLLLTCIHVAQQFRSSILTHLQSCSRFIAAEIAGWHHHPIFVLQEGLPSTPTPYYLANVN